MGQVGYVQGKSKKRRVVSGVLAVWIAGIFSLALVAVGSLVGGVSGASAETKPVETKQVQIDQYTLTVPTGTVSPADVLSVVVTGGTPGETVLLRDSNGIDIVNAAGRRVTAFGEPGSATFDAAGSAKILFAAHAGAFTQLNGDLKTFTLTGEVQLPERAFQPVFQITPIESVRVAVPSNVRAGEPWVVSVSDGRPDTVVRVSLDNRLFRTFQLDANGNGLLATVFRQARDIEVNVLIVSVGSRDVYGFNNTLTVAPSQAPITRTTETPQYETFNLSQYTITVPTGLVFAGEQLEVIIDGGTPGATPVLEGSYIVASTVFPPSFDANGRVRIPFEVGELNLSQVPIPLVMFLPDFQVGAGSVAEIVGEIRRPTQPTPTTAPVTTTLAPVGAFVISAPNQVAVGEAFTASVGGLRPGAIVAFTAGANELGWAVANQSGIASITNSVWARGSFSLSAREIEDGIIVVREANKPLQVGASVPITKPGGTAFDVTAPSTASVGANFSVGVSRLDVDSLVEVQIGDVTFGWASTDADGNAMVTNALWSPGRYDVVVTEWRYGNKLSTQTIQLVVQ